MDVTPQQLRAPQVREAVRGYHRTQVDLLLERAAATIEKLTEQLQQPRAVAASYVGQTDAETIHRTLILAQRTADEVIAEAQERARQTLEESESKAQSLVGDAEASARRMYDDEKRQLQVEVEGMVARRDRLQADADALETYASEYRARVWAAIEADLAKIGVSIEAPTARPGSRDIEPDESVARAQSAGEQSREQSREQGALLSNA